MRCRDPRETLEDEVAHLFVGEVEAKGEGGDGFCAGNSDAGEYTVGADAGSGDEAESQSVAFAVPSA